MQKFLGRTRPIAIDHPKRVSDARTIFGHPFETTLFLETAMADQYESIELIALFVRTFGLSLFANLGLCVALSGGDISCDARLTSAIIGLTSGSVLFIQVVCVQIARYYRARALAPRKGSSLGSRVPTNKSACIATPTWSHTSTGNADGY